MTFEQWAQTTQDGRWLCKSATDTEIRMIRTAWDGGRASAATWIPITDRLPEPGVPVIALVNPNEYGKTYRIRAQWAPAKTLELHFDAEGGEYDEETDTYYCEEGWYETNEYEEVHWNVHGTVTHWQPLPEIPEELKVKA